MSERKDDLSGFDLTTEQQRLFARLLEEEGIEVAKPPGAVSRAASVSEQIPLSFAQQRLWLLEQLEPGTSLYHIPITLRLTGPLDQSALQQALTEIVRRHEVLRAGLNFSLDQPTQVIAPQATWDLPFKDLSQLADTEKEAQALIDRLAREPFDLGKDRLVRARLLRVAEDDHLLPIVMHHLVSDGWSFRIFFRELSSLYTAFSQGMPSPLPELSVQYADYAIWQRDWLQGAALISQLDYWKHQLRGAPALLELPADYQRPATHTLRGGQLNKILAPELVADLENLSRREGVTLFMALLAATKLLLWRHTGQPDIVVGIPISGRSRTEFEKLIGFFINTLVLRTELSGDMSFRELMARVRDVCIAAYDHQEMPFEKLVEELQPQRSLNHTPLFQVFFNMFSLFENLPELPGLEVKALSPPEIGSKFDLTFYLRPYNRRLMITVAYNKDLFADERIQEMLEQLNVLLTDIARNPDASISSYSLRTSRARKVLPDPNLTIFSEWKGSFASLFAKQARLTPDRLAVKDKSGDLTYRQLDELSNQIANRLLAHGLARQDIVAIYADRGATIVLAVLGILKAGGVFMILDPAYPARRLIYYLRAAQPKVWLQSPDSLTPELEEFIAESSLLCRLPLAGVVSGAGVFNNSPVTDPAVAVAPRDLAYVAFTSGSTGKPKGVMGTHDSLTHYPNWLKETFAVNESDRFSMLSGLAHDPSLRDIFSPLALGAALCIPDPEFFDVPGRLALWMQAEKITIANLTPAMGQLLTTGATGDTGPALTELRCAFFVGDTLTRSSISSFRKLAPYATCVNLYGATETQRSLSYYVVPAEESVADATPLSKEVIPVGQGIHGVQLLVLRDGLQSAGIGELGEIYFRSPYLARGYLKDDATTQEQFLINPWTNAPGDCLYKTGDLGRYLLDGNVEIAGRSDEQVKIRGYRIELGEIEAALRRQDGIENCVVLARERPGGERQLVSYLVWRTGAHIVESSALRRHLESELPPYMIPSAFVMLKDLPLTPNGKLDREALPDPERPSLETTFVAARTPIEGIVAGISESLLRLDKIGAEDNFFELGGHSLLAMQVIAKLRDALQIEIPARVFFESPTVAGLAQNVEKLKALPVASDSPIQPTARDSLAPLSINQEARLFREWRQSMESTPRKQFHTRNAFRLEGKLDADVLERSLNEVIRRHEALRATFIKRQGGLNSKWLAPILNKALALKGIIRRLRRFARKGFVQATLYDQIILSEAALKLQRIDLRHLDEARREAEFQRICNEEIGRLFDYSQAPLFRALLFTFADEEHRLCLVIHHFVCDGWSVGVIMKEIASLYPAFLRGEPSPLPDPRLQFRDFARWQRERLQGELLEDYLEYWKGHLEGVGFVPELRMPFIKPRQSPLVYRGARQVMTVPDSMLKALVEMSRRRGVTMFMLMLASIKTLLYQYTNKEHIGVFTPYANRLRPEASGIVGWLANFHVLCSDLSGNPKFSELLNRVRESVLGAYVHQEVPSSLLFVSLLDHFHGQLPQRLFEVPTVSFGLVDRTRQSPPIDGLKVTPVEILFNTGDPGSLEFAIIEEPNGLKIEIRYLRESFDPTDIESMLENLVGLLEVIVAEPETRLSDFPLGKIHFATQ